MQLERFLCYIRGGSPIGRNDVYKGCGDKTLPEENDGFNISSRLYFAKRYKGWKNGGVAFISNTFKSNFNTLARMYLITEDQFIDVVKQETKHEGELNIDFEKCIKNDSLVFRDPSWYGNLIYLGEQNDKPIFTFTSKTDFVDQVNKPNDFYLKTIIEGIKETFPSFKDLDICEYLLPLDGIKGNYTEEQLIALVAKKMTDLF